MLCGKHVVDMMHVDACCRWRPWSNASIFATRRFQQKKASASSVSCKSQQEKPLKRRSEMNYKPSNCKVLHDEAWIKMFHHSRFLNHRLGAVSAMAPPSDCFASGFRTALHQYNDFSCLHWWPEFLQGIPPTASTRASYLHPIWEIFGASAASTESLGKRCTM